MGPRKAAVAKTYTASSARPMVAKNRGGMTLEAIATVVSNLAAEKAPPTFASALVACMATKQNLEEPSLASKGLPEEFVIEGSPNMSALALLGHVLYLVTPEENGMPEFVSDYKVSIGGGPNLWNTDLSRIPPKAVKRDKDGRPLPSRAEILAEIKNAGAPPAELREAIQDDFSYWMPNFYYSKGGFEAEITRLEGICDEEAATADDKARLFYYLKVFFEEYPEDAMRIFQNIPEGMVELRENINSYASNVLKLRAFAKAK